MSLAGTSPLATSLSSRPRSGSQLSRELPPILQPQDRRLCAMSRHRAPCGRLSESAQSQHSRCSLNAALQHRKQSLVRGAAERGLKSRLRPSLPFPSTQPLLQTRHSSRIVACARYATSNSIPLTGSVPRKLPFAESTVGSGGGGYRWKCGHSPHRSLCAGMTQPGHTAIYPINAHLHRS